MRVGALRFSISRLVACAVAAALLYWIVEANLREEFHRARSIGVSTEMRAIAVALYKSESAAKGSVLGRSPYWGPLSPELLQSIGISPDKAVDPFNRSLPKKQWRTNPESISDSFAWDSLRGGELQFFCNGDGFWMIIGRGPDGILNFSKTDLDSISSQWKNENGNFSFDFNQSLLAPFAYDPTNGTVSGGDLYRISEE